MAVLSDWKPEFYQIHYNSRKDTTRYLLVNAELGMLCWGEVDGAICEKSELDTNTMSELPCQALKVEDFFPVYHADTMLQHPVAPNHPSVFIKKQRILRSDTFLIDPSRFEILTRREVGVCELLRQHPHPNIARYLGCETANFSGVVRVTGIAYEKHDMNLAEYVAEDLLKFEQVWPILSAVENAMKHLHKLGIVHCDLQPRNVFLRLKTSCSPGREVDEVVLGDFDSALRVGEVIELKHATKYWWPEGVGYGDVARPEIDRHSFRQLRPWLIQRTCD